jgi:hypothetical protein
MKPDPNMVGVSRRGHKLLTPETCKCNKNSDQKCPVCDWGLGVCEWCGAAESQLDNNCPNYGGVEFGKSR